MAEEFIEADTSMSGLKEAVRRGSFGILSDSLLEELTKPAFENESGEIKPVLMLVRHSVGILEGSHWGKIHS